MTDGTPRRRRSDDDAQTRADDDRYVRDGLRRRDEVRRLRLADGLPRELGGRRSIVLDPGGRRAAALAARAHLLEAGLYGPASDAVLRASA